MVVLPRKIYEALLRGKKNNSPITIKRDSSFKIKKGQEKFYDKLDKDLTRIVREVKKGKVVGPFNNAKDLMASLNS